MSGHICRQQLGWRHVAAAALLGVLLGIYRYMAGAAACAHASISSETLLAAPLPQHAHSRQPAAPPPAQVVEGLNDTTPNLLAAIDANEPEVSPSTLYAVACIQEGVPFVNGSPQNTFVPGLIDMAVDAGVLIGGDDFKSGQTKVRAHTPRGWLKFFASACAPHAASRPGRQQGVHPLDTRSGHNHHQQQHHHPAPARS